LEGDRSFAGTGFPSWYAEPLREVSLIEEVVEALWRDHNLSLAPGLHRRTIVTRGVPLGPPVGREFAVGGVRLRGVEISEPCTHLVDVTGIRGGLHAQILEDGIIVRGDPIEERAEV
jgi:MOSC domain-containing protein YiiM